ncbi:hypothetical protein [Corynebacterium sp. HS2168-gen11]|uniref:hypothetical protein n=1 Tax=Corynebacterium sp. HS2168-gen11 TaxID=2974027 RepID=UPI00216AC774|nr:hypothetical protein [Corynebacterium sp. HS2168-gen11]MCS4535639.1 hypothetical protein [Corynebacterium sp. HS2168-gen11]
MELTARGRGIIAVGVTAMIAFVAIMVVSSMTARPLTTTGSLERFLHAASQQHRKVVGVSWQELYGDQFARSLVVCPGATKDMLIENLALEPKHVAELPSGEIPEGENYLMSFALEQSGQNITITEVKTQRFDQSVIDLCSQPAPVRFVEPVGWLVQNEETHSWMLAN